MVGNNCLKKIIPNSLYEPGIISDLKSQQVFIDWKIN